MSGPGSAAGRQSLAVLSPDSPPAAAGVGQGGA